MTKELSTFEHAPAAQEVSNLTARRIGWGRFVTFEGIEGAGKSSQIDNARDLLLGAGLQVVTTREPGGSAIAERIRALLLDPSNAGLNQTAELLLMFAARSEHLHMTIVPALQSGAWVLCDRFTDATYAYQGGGRGLDPCHIALLENLVQGELRPDLTLLFDLPVDIGLERAGRRSAPDRFEAEAHEFFEAVRNCYLDRARQEPQRMRIIDAARDLTSVAAQVRDLLQGLLAEVRVVR